MRFFLHLATAAFLMAPALAAQESFTVTIEDDPSAPIGEAFAINGVLHDELTLTRGETYEFDVSGVTSIHFFFISQSETGGDGGEESWDDDVTNNGANGSSGNTTVTFAVPESSEDVPDLLYYQCGPHTDMGGEIHIANPSNVEEDPNAGFALSVVSQNPGASRVTVGLALAEAGEVSVEVFDVRGRRVGVLHEGALAAGDDHRFQVGANLRPGVYVVRATDGERTAELSVTLVR